MVRRIRRLCEGVQMIHIGPNTVLTQTAIQYALSRARTNYMYAKFYTDRYYIQVNFMRDNSINVSTNITYQGCINDLRRRDRQGWDIISAKEFVYQWMSIYRKMLR